MAGRKIKFHDEYHKRMRELERDYRRRNREVLNFAQRLRISVSEARKRLGVKPNLKKIPGQRKKRKKGGGC